MNLSLESWHNHFAAIQAVDQAAIQLENDGASSYKYVCMLF